MDSWEFENNPGKQTVLALVCIAAGGLLAIGFRHFDSSGMSNSRAGFLCGLLLLIIGIWAFLVSGKQTIIVDPQRCRIVVEDKTKFGIKRRLIGFSEITDTSIGYLGKRSNYVNFYYIILKLKSGENYALFPPGRFHEGGSDRSVMESRRQRLENCIQQAASK